MASQPWGQWRDKGLVLLSAECFDTWSLPTPLRNPPFLRGDSALRWGPTVCQAGSDAGAPQRARGSSRLFAFPGPSSQSPPLSLCACGVSPRAATSTQGDFDPEGHQTLPGHISIVTTEGALLASSR